MSKYILILLGFFWGYNAQAQQGLQYTQFMFNKMYFNPAYAGSKGSLLLSAVYRKQWLGIERAPQSATFNAHGALLGQKLGLGLSLNYDQIGFSTRVNAQTNYSYIIRFENNSFFSIGLRGSVSYAQIRWSEADLLDNFDAAIPQSTTSKILPNFGAGIYYQSQKWYLGVSVPHIFKNKGDFNIPSPNNGTIEPDFKQEYYAMSGYYFDLDPNIKIQQNLLLKYVVGAPLATDINLSFVFFDKILLGVTYRVGASVDAMVQWQITPQFRIAAAYDFSITELQRYNSGSMEAMISYQFFKPETGDKPKIGEPGYKPSYDVETHRFF